FGLAEVAKQALLGVSSLLVADDRDRLTVKLREPGDDGPVVAVRSIAVQFHEVGKQQRDVILGIRPLRVPCDLRTLPGSEVRVRFVSQLGNLLTDALQLHAGIGGAGQVPQFFDVFFQAVDLPLSRAFGMRLSLFVGHQFTTSMDCSPHNSRIALTNSLLRLTRSRNSRVATVPSAAKSWKTTGLRPG